jgi:hypothetical protein
MTKANLQHTDDRPDRDCVTIDNRFHVAVIRTEAGIRIEVFPFTDGQIWDDPFERFEVDESEVRVLEQEIAHD